MASASRPNRARASAPGAAEKVFTATIRPRARSRALYTTPIPPRPTSPWRSYPGIAGDPTGGAATAPPRPGPVGVREPGRPVSAASGRRAVRCSGKRSQSSSAKAGGAYRFRRANSARRRSTANSAAASSGNRAR